MTYHLPLCDEAWNHEFIDKEPCGICKAIIKAENLAYERGVKAGFRAGRPDAVNYWTNLEKERIRTGVNNLTGVNQLDDPVWEFVWRHEVIAVIDTQEHYRV